MGIVNCFTAIFDAISKNDYFLSVCLSVCVAVTDSPPNTKCNTFLELYFYSFYSSGDCSTLNTADLCLTRRTKDVTTKPQSSHENIKTMIVSKNPHWDSTEQSYHFIHTFEGESTRLNLIGNNLGRSKQDKTPFYSPLDHNGECLRRIISPSRRRNSFESDKSHRRKTVSRAVSLPMSRSRFSGDSELVRNKVLRKSNPGMAGNCRNAAGQMSVKSVDDSNRANSQNEAIHHIHHRSDEINYLHQ